MLQVNYFHDKEEGKPEQMCLLWSFFQTGLSSTGDSEKLSGRKVQEDAKEGEPA